MTEQLRVYIVTSGTYSDYRINKVFSKKELAEAYLEQIKDIDSDWSIEEYLLDEDTDLIQRRVYVYTLFSEEAQRAPYCRMAVEEGLPTDRTPKQCVGIGAYNSDEHRYFTGRSFVSEEHAKKLAVEVYQKWLRLSKSGRPQHEIVDEIQRTIEKEIE